MHTDLNLAATLSACQSQRLQNARAPGAVPERHPVADAGGRPRDIVLEAGEEA